MLVNRTNKFVNIFTLSRYVCFAWPHQSDVENPYTGFNSAYSLKFFRSMAYYRARNDVHAEPGIISENDLFRSWLINLVILKENRDNLAVM